MIKKRERMEDVKPFYCKSYIKSTKSSFYMTINVALDKKGFFLTACVQPSIHRMRIEFFYTHRLVDFT